MSGQVTGPSWYDVLGVEASASPDEVREAWRATSAGVDPGTPRFRTLSEAAEVLLDGERRAAYDASLAAPSLTEREIRRERRRGERARDVAANEARRDVEAEDRVAGVPTWLLGVLGVLALAMVAATAWAYERWNVEDVEESARAAQSAAERAIVPVLSYDAADLEADQSAAQAFLTSDYRADYDQLFALIEQNAPGTGTRVEVEVVASGIVRAEPDRVQILLFVDRPTTNKQTSEPVVYRDQVTVTMQDVGGEWLVDDLETSPVEQ